MFSYFKKKPGQKYDREHSPLKLQIDRQNPQEASKEAAYAETLSHLSSELKDAQEQINILLEEKKSLESQLLEKEKENLSLFEKMSSLTTNYAEEKETLIKKQRTFLEEEKILLEKITKLQDAVSAKETECQILLERIPPLEAVVHEKAVLEEENRLQQEQNQALLKRISEMEVAKHKLEYALNQEKAEHEKIQALYEEEKSLHEDSEMDIMSEIDDDKPSVFERIGLFSAKKKPEEKSAPMSFMNFYPGMMWQNLP